MFGDRRQSGSGDGRWQRWPRSLSAKLIALLVATLLVSFGLLGFANIRLHRQHLERNILTSAERISDTLKRGTSYSMLRNDREGLYHTITTMGGQPGVVRIRIFNKEGRISFSTDAAESGTLVNKRAEACFACHARERPLEHLDRPDRFRIFRTAGGERVLGIINPIENQPSCSSAACHAHPPGQKILGVLDTHLSLAVADADIAESSRQMLTYTLLAVTGICLLLAAYVLRFVHQPLRALEAGTRRLSQGELGYQIGVRAGDEIGDLAASFNNMSRELREAREESNSWARTLEERVEQKSRELERAHERMLQVEKMASVGKLAAVVAHEINNPLAGILTYTKLIRKWLSGAARDAGRRAEVDSSLELIESESRRCGEIVRNLLTFARAAPMNLAWISLNDVVGRALRLVLHQLELAGIEVRCETAPDLTRVRCDPAQMEQVLLALIMNSIDAMPRGGRLWLRTSATRDDVVLEVRDDGAGIPRDVLPHLFEPFFTTKERGRGVGLGLAISRGIVERHGGRIEVFSEVGRGTTFTVTLPVEASAPAAEGAPTPEEPVKAR
jgi:two-component system NtrC family sensor kinase